jgi:sugar phosphate isomerase/epimerase
MEDMLAFATEIGPNVGILVDSLHWHCLGSDCGALEAVPSDRLVYAHINDAPDVPREEQRDDDRLLPGEGAIDLCGFLSALRAAGYDGPVGIEIDGPALLHFVPDEAASRARLAWTKLLADCQGASIRRPPSPRP